MIFKNSKVYDVLKWLALVALDAVGLAYSSLSAVWNLPFGDEVEKTCIILSVLIGTLIGVSGLRYQHNDLDVNNFVYKGESNDEE